ncbi:response regulator [Maridesulfovibrio zosterae]|uniref:response regulator n=1 Tax=Maridesulfovibrio zosterae TaxID=82171 RepID=UPI0004018C4C|nr:response regulator [Maridesulfovibrio zosterae]
MHSTEVRILIVERNPRMRDFLRREFSRRNFILEDAGNVGELFSKLDSDIPVHLVVLSVNAPEGLDGELLQQLVTNYPHIPVILHSYLEELSDEPFLRKVAAMVEKSGNPENLTRMVSVVLSRYYPDLISDEPEKDDV